MTFVSRRERRRQAKPSLARAVASNAGTVGRGAAVAFATSGLIVSSGVAANAAADETQAREITTLSVAQSGLSVERASSNASVAVTASQSADLSFDRPVVTSTPAPEPEAAPEPEPEVEVVPVAQQETVETTEAPEAETAPEVEVEQEETQAEVATQVEESEPEAETEEAEPAPESTGGGNDSIVSAAYSYTGVPYLWGGTSSSGLDCSGLITLAYQAAGKSVPRSTYGMMAGMQQVSSPEPGDIVISNGGAHGGIYVGNGQVVSATVSGGVRLHGLNEGWHTPTMYLRG